MSEESGSTSIDKDKLIKLLDEMRASLSGYLSDIRGLSNDLLLYIEIINRLSRDIGELSRSISETTLENLPATKIKELSNTDEKIYKLSLGIYDLINKISGRPLNIADQRFYIQMLLDGLKRLKELLEERKNLIEKKEEGLS